MQHDVTPQIKYRPDGSIDTAHYMEIGRQKRAEQARTLTKMALPRRGIFSLHFWSFKVERTG